MTTETLGYPKGLKMENPLGFSCTFARTPPLIGYYCLRRPGFGDMKLTMSDKPKWITRFLMKHLLEIDWEDA